jgi:lipopolysaccharide transport system permease protein
MDEARTEMREVSPVTEANPMPVEVPAPPAVAAPALSADDLPVTVIEPRPGWQIIDLAELWRYRELLWCLTWRDISVRYKQAVFGAGWAIIQPLATMFVFTMFLGRALGAEESDAPYPLHVFAGMMMWTFFSGSISSAGNSLVGNQNLVTKVYFPRLVVPLSAVGVGLVDLGVAAVMLVGLMVWYGIVPGLPILMVPVVLLLMCLAAVGIGTLLAALMVAYRDFRFVLNFGVQLWMIATPCIYLDPETALGERSRLLLPLNPAYGLILNFQLAVLGREPDLYALVVSGAVGVLMVFVGLAYFRRVESSFADVI